MINSVIDDARLRMGKSVVTLKMEVSKLRVDRAHPSLLEHIKVNHYNIDVSLYQVATIAVENPHMLTVTPWEKNIVGSIEKAIRKADLGLNPMIVGAVIRIPLPPITEERRKELSRIVRDEAEKARVAIRNIRREANNNLKVLLKEKKISEDEERHAQNSIQKLTNIQILEVDKISSQKKSDLMAI